VIPGTSSFYGNWIEDMLAGQFVILGDFVSIIIVITLVISGVLLWIRWSCTSCLSIRRTSSRIRVLVTIARRFRAAVARWMMRLWLSSRETLWNCPARAAAMTTRCRTPTMTTPSLGGPTSDVVKPAYMGVPSRGRFEGECARTAFPLLTCLRTHYGRHCEPFSGQKCTKME